MLLHQGLHPRIIAEGFDAAKTKALEVLDEIKVEKEMKREILLDVARTSLRTKVHAELADVLTEVYDPLLSSKDGQTCGDILLLFYKTTKYCT